MIKNFAANCVRNHTHTTHQIKLVLWHSTTNNMKLARHVMSLNQFYYLLKIT